MNRKEYELVYDALKNYHVYMDKDQRLLAEQILDEVFVFNGWTFASSPTVRPFDHPVYDICAYI